MYLEHDQKFLEVHTTLPRDSWRQREQCWQGEQVISHCSLLILLFAAYIYLTYSSSDNVKMLRLLPQSTVLLD